MDTVLRLWAWWIWIRIQQHFTISLSKKIRQGYLLPTCKTNPISKTQCLHNKHWDLVKP